jgi:hypothetical protein
MDLSARERALREAASYEEPLRRLIDCVHELYLDWWLDLETGQPKPRNFAEMMMLAVTELAEAVEGHRKSLQDDHLPHRRMAEVEIADCLIRLFDAAAGCGFDVAAALVEKLRYNARRPDHTLEARRLPGGKAY